MPTPDSIPTAAVLPIAAVLWSVVLWPAIPRAIRERLTPHKWVRTSAWVGGYERECHQHDRCRGVVRYYNDRGVRLCAASSFRFLPEHDDCQWTREAEAPIHCDLYHRHRTPHYNIAADRTWRDGSNVGTGFGG